MSLITDKQRIEEIFARGTVVEVLPSRDALLERMLAGERLRIYIGVDPTGESLHIGHAKNLMFLEELRQLGHEVILLFGDFTARIGDPTGRGTARQQLSEADVARNMAGWMEQVKPILAFDDPENPPRIMRNSEWLAKLSFADVVGLAANFTVQQMLERDMFERRIAAQEPIHLHEFLYPLMQGYDSVAMDVDAELCGTDQTFNALAGRTLMKRLKDKEKLVIALNLLANPKTGELMSKSKGTGVLLSSGPAEMYGSVMAQDDALIEPLLVNCTRISMDEVAAILAEGPRKAKARVALDITARFHGKDAAHDAQEQWEKTFADGGVPDEIPEVALMPDQALAEALVEAGIIESKTEWRRLVDEGAVRTDGDEKISDPQFSPAPGTVLKIGKRRFVRIVR